MKKFFTLLSVACMAMAANASEPLGLPSPWGATCVLDVKTYTFDGSWAGAGLWLGTEADGVQTWYDASAYDYAYISYTAHTGGDVNFGVQYNKFEKEESWGAVYTTVSKKIDQEEGFVVVKLDKTTASDNGLTCAQEIRQIQLQDAGSACSLTVEEIAFITEEEYQAILAGQAPTIKIKEFALPGEEGVVNMTEGENNAGWYSSSWIGLENLADDGYKYFIIEIASADAPFQVLAQNWPGGEQRTQVFEATTEPITVVFKIGEGEDELVGLGQYALQNMNIEGESWMDPVSGEMVSWYNENKVVVTRAYLTSGEPGEEPGEVDPNVIYDGGETLSWGAVNIDGDKLMGLTAPVKLAITVQSTTGGWWQLKFCDSSWQSLNLNGAEFINANSVEGFGWNTEDFTFIVELDADQLAKAINGMIAQGSGGEDGGSIILKKVAIVTSDAISAIEATPATEAVFNIAGQRTNATTGLMIRGGKVIMVK